MTRIFLILSEEAAREVEAEVQARIERLDRVVLGVEHLLPDFPAIGARLEQERARLSKVADQLKAPA